MLKLNRQRVLHGLESALTSESRKGKNDLLALAHGIIARRHYVFEGKERKGCVREPFKRRQQGRHSIDSLTI